MSKRYNQVKEKIAEEQVNVSDAIKTIKENASAKFDETVEVHIRLGIDPKKSDQKVRSSVSFPFGVGKAKRVAVFTETKQKEAKEAGADLIGGQELIEEIQKTSKIDFDVAIATPEMMPKLAKAAKILGPKGLMPNPKTGTVSEDVKKVVSEFKAGKSEFKSDDSGNIHIAVGKVSFAEENLKENFDFFIDALKKAKPDNQKGIFIKSVSMCSTMSPGVKIKL
ncbi:MAG: 50S ribosomal protein L1 [bacterium]